MILIKINLYSMRREINGGVSLIEGWLKALFLSHSRSPKKLILQRRCAGGMGEAQAGKLFWNTVITHGDTCQPSESDLTTTVTTMRVKNYRKLQ